MQFAEEKATVSHFDGEFVFLDTQNSAACNNCLSKSGCGSVSSIFTFKSKNKLKVINTLGLKSGDTVIVSMPVDRLLKATVLMYLTPLLLLFIFAFIAKLLMGETVSIFAGLIGLFAGLLMVKTYTQQKFVANKFQPKLLRKIINVEPVDSLIY